MPPGLRPIPPPASHRHAVRAFAVINDGQRIGVVALVLTQRPHGATLRRDWWAIPPAGDTRPIPRPFDTRGAAVQTLRYRHATLTRPEPAPVIDATLRSIRAAYDSAGPNAAVWLAASLTVHHLREIDTARREGNPPALWREIRRIVAWLQAATGDESDSFLRQVCSLSANLERAGVVRCTRLMWCTSRCDNLDEGHRHDDPAGAEPYVVARWRCWQTS